LNAKAKEREIQFNTQVEVACACSRGGTSGFCGVLHVWRGVKSQKEKCLLVIPREQS